MNADSFRTTPTASLMRIVAKRLREDDSVDRQIRLLGAFHTRLLEAPWSEIKDTGITEAIIDAAIAAPSTFVSYEGRPITREGDILTLMFSKTSKTERDFVDTVIACLVVHPESASLYKTGAPGGEPKSKLVALLNQAFSLFKYLSAQNIAQADNDFVCHLGVNVVRLISQFLEGTFREDKEL